MEEYWDIYDKFKTKTGEIIKRDGDRWLQSGEYHLVITGIIQNLKNEILISKRKEDKKLYPNLWECTGGSAKTGESSIQATLREIHEEIGVVLKESEGKFLGTIQHDNYFRDVWNFIRDIQDNEIKFNDGEVTETKWVTLDKYEELFANGEIVPSGHYVIDMLRKKDLEVER